MTQACSGQINSGTYLEAAYTQTTVIWESLEEITPVRTSDCECEMQIIHSMLKDVFIVKPVIFEDNRGFFYESYNANKFREIGIEGTFVQDNRSYSTKGVIRGLHYQIVHPQGKLVSVTSGEIFDVIVDLRKSSPTFGKWQGYTLSAENKNILWAPAGFAHGFLTTSKEAEIFYKVTDYYEPAGERTILWNDPDLAIDWPITEGMDIILSNKDNAGLLFKDAEKYPEGYKS